MKNKIAFYAFLILAINHLEAQTHEVYQWGKVSLGGGGAVPAIIAHPRVSGAVFSTHDVCGPNRWDETRQKFEYALSFPYWMYPQSNAGCECLTFDPNDLSGNTALLSITNQAGFNKESYLLRTTNRGVTWEYSNFKPMAGSEQFNARYHIQYDPNNSNVVYYAARNGGIYMSTDGGINFEKTSAPDGLVNDLDRPKANTGIRKIIVNPYLGIVTNPVRSRVLYAEVATGDWVNYMIESYDGGQTWHNIGMPKSPKVEIGKSGRVYLAGANSTGFWENNKFTSFSVSGNSISIDPSDENRIVVYKNLGADQYEFYYSSNRGVSWKTLKPVYKNYPNWYKNDGGCTAPQGGCSNPIDGSFTFDADGRLWYSDWYQIWRCDVLTNQSSNIEFTGVVNGEEETVNIGDGLASPWGGNCKVMIGVADVGGFAITDLKKWPEKTALTPNHNIVGLDWAGKNPNKLAFVAAQGWGWDHVGWGGYSDDGGLTTHYFPSRPLSGSMLCSRIALNASGTRFFWYTNSGLYYSDNNGNSWTLASNLTFGYESIFDWKGYRAIAADRINDNLIYLNNNDKLYRSDNNGITWALINSNSIGSLFLNPEVEGEIWIMSWDSKGGTLKRSIDKGVTFSRIENVSELKSFGFGKGPADGQPSIYIIGKANGNPGIYRSDNYGASWIRIDDLNQYPHPMIGSFIAGDGQVYGRVYVGSHSGTWVGTSLTQCDTCSISNKPPYVAISEPTKTNLATNTEFDVEVYASDPNDNIQKVELFIDSVKTGEISTSPYKFTIDGLNSGKHLLEAKAWDSFNESSTAFLTVTVSDLILVANSSNKLTEVTIDGIMDPAYNSQLNDCSKYLSANSSDLSAQWTSCWKDSSFYFWISEKNVSLNTKSNLAELNDRIELTLLPNINYVESVLPDRIIIYPADSSIQLIRNSITTEFKSGVSVINTTDGFDVECIIDTKNFGILPFGRSYVGFDIRIFDLKDIPETEGSPEENAYIGWNSSSSDSILGVTDLGLLFLEPVNQIPFCKITAPFNNRIYSTKPLLIAIYVDASDKDGSITKVDFFANDVLIGTDVSSPYSIGNSTLPNGSYILKAIAYDNEGGFYESGTVPISVDILTDVSTGNVFDEILIYPNPSNSGIIQLSEIADIELSDISGKLLVANSNTSSIITNGLGKGMYFLRINNSIVKKVILN